MKGIVNGQERILGTIYYQLVMVMTIGAINYQLGMFMTIGTINYQLGMVLSLKLSIIN